MKHSSWVRALRPVVIFVIAVAACLAPFTSNLTGSSFISTSALGLISSAAGPGMLRPAPVVEASGDVTITNLVVASGKAYEWDSAIAHSKLQYIDRAFTFSSIPSEYLNLHYLKTANDDKASTGENFVSFTVDQAVTVHVAHDDRITPKPGWLASFTPTGTSLVSGGGIFSIFAKDFPAGTVVLGGNDGPYASMYTVMVSAQGAISLPTPTQTASPTPTVTPDPLEPQPGAMTVYRVTNPNGSDLSVQHVFTDTAGFYHSFVSIVPANGVAEYRVRDMAEIPSPFQGSLTLNASTLFTAEVIGYDYPSSDTPTATPTATATATPTSTQAPPNSPTATPTTTPVVSPTTTPTVSHTSTPTFTPTNTATSVPALTSTPTPTSTVLHTTTPTWTPTNTPASTQTVAPTQTSTATATATATKTPVTLTATPTSTSTAAATKTATATPTPTSTTTNKKSPQPRSVTPGRGRNSTSSDIAVSGTDFESDAVVSLEANGSSTELLQEGGSAIVLATRGAVAENRLHTVVPAGLAPGVYDLVVHNPSTGTTGRLARAYIVLPPTGDVLFADTSDLWTNPVTVRHGQSVQLGLNLHRNGGQSAIRVPVRFYLGDPASGGSLIGEVVSDPMPPQVQRSSVALTWQVPAQGASATIFAVIDAAETLSRTLIPSGTISRELTLVPAFADKVQPEILDVVINGGAADSNNPIVSVGVTAVDPAPGSGVVSKYIVEREFHQAAGAWVAMSQSGWITFTSPYVLTLTDRAGVRYIQTYVADRAGNVSAVPFERQLNYLPSTDRLEAGQVRLFRRTLSAGGRLRIQLEPMSGDADLWVWSPSGSAVLVRNASGTVIDEGELLAGEDGVYQIEVLGFTDTTYRLTVQTVSALSGLEKPDWFFESATGSSVEYNSTKPVRTEPLVPVSDRPETSAAIPAAPIVQTSSLPHTVYLPLVTRSSQSPASGW